MLLNTHFLPESAIKCTQLELRLGASESQRLMPNSKLPKRVSIDYMCDIKRKEAWRPLVTLVT